MFKKEPRGIRNNNPGNIRLGSPWQGLVSKREQTDPSFCQFIDPASGIRAIAITLITYQDKRLAKDGSRIDTIREVIERWAPPIENDTNSYAMAISDIIHLNPDLPELDLKDYATLRGVIEGIIRQENGRGPLKTVNTWYDSETIEEGIRRSGVVRQLSPTAVSKTSIAAIGTTVIGAAQAMEVVQPVKAAMVEAQENLTSGDWVRISLGLGTIGIGLYIAWVQWKKHKAGAST